MLRFIDINNGSVFSGTKPYVHWFSEGQSTNINYYKEIVFTSDASSLDISIDDPDSCFKLMTFSDPHMVENINGFDYYHIEEFLTNALHLTGISYNGVYLYRFFVYAFSSSTGEYIVDVNIGDEVIQVGADFYPENELLTNDLENLGIEIPMQIQKAIYESNVHEEAMDNILMNRKWKELLLEYWNIVACKGSYRSLVNSMKFFEYGDLVKIQEWWKARYNKDIFISNDLEQILNDRFREQLSVLSKTTYIGLYLALEKIVQEENGTVLTEWDVDPSDPFAQDNPRLQKISSIWSAIDLSLKMTLVGNFFSTYFMPLHLDLIHSTIEDVCFTNVVNLLTSASMNRRDFVDLSGWFQTSVKKGQNFYIGPQDVYVTPRTILGFKDFDVNNAGNMSMLRDDPTTHYSKGVKFLGVDYECDTSYANSFGGTPYDLIFTSQNIIHLFGAVVPIDVKIVSNVRPDSALKSAQIHWVKDSNEIYSYFDNGIWVTPVLNEETLKWEYDFDFRLMFTDPGEYHFFVTFTSADSFLYSQEFRVNILDDIDNPIHIYKVERVDPNLYKDWEVKVIGDTNAPQSNKIEIVGNELEYELNEFMFSQRYRTPDFSYNTRQYLCADITNLSKSTGLNHVIMFANQYNGSNAKVGSVSANGASASSLKGTYPDYWWFERTVYTTIDEASNLNDAVTVITGIRKYYTIEQEASILYKEVFTKGDAVGKVTIYQLRDKLYTSVHCTGGGTCYITNCDLSNYVTFEVFGHKEKVRVYPDWNWYELEYSSNGNPKGHIDDKVKCEGDFFQLVDEDRFIPMLHKLVKVTEKNCEILPSELIVAIPELKRTYDMDSFVWKFKNSSTMESITMSKGLRQVDGNNYVNLLDAEDDIDYYEPLIGKFEPRALTPGYYNIDLNYKYADEIHTESRDAAFKIRKSLNK